MRARRSARPAPARGHDGNFRRFLIVRRNQRLGIENELVVLIELKFRFRCFWSRGSARCLRRQVPRGGLDRQRRTASHGVLRLHADPEAPGSSILRGSDLAELDSREAGSANGRIHRDARAWWRVRRAAGTAGAGSSEIENSSRPSGSGSFGGNSNSGAASAAACRSVGEPLSRLALRASRPIRRTRSTS